MYSAMKSLRCLVVGVLVSWQCLGSEYQIDTKGAHAFIVFKIPHLGYSMLLGQFERFSGEFSYDANNPEASSIVVEIDTTSLDSNHAERDKHLKGEDYLDTENFPNARFASTEFIDKGDGRLQVIGDLTLHGVTRPITIEATKVGEGRDPWGGYRAGFSGSTVLKLRDFDIPERLGPASTEVQMELHIEGIRQHDWSKGKPGT